MTEIYRDYEPQLVGLLASFEADLSPDAVGHVRHYIGVGEYEMAFESLVLSLMEEGVSVSASAVDEIAVLGAGLNMEEEAVFRADFWEVTVRWLQALQRNDS